MSKKSWPEMMRLPNDELSEMALLTSTPQQYGWLSDQGCGTFGSKGKLAAVMND
jgi:hypothetical protein